MSTIQNIIYTLRKKISVTSWYQLYFTVVFNLLKGTFFQFILDKNTFAPSLSTLILQELLDFLSTCTARSPGAAGIKVCSFQFPLFISWVCNTLITFPFFATIEKQKQLSATQQAYMGSRSVDCSNQNTYKNSHVCDQDVMWPAWTDGWLLGWLVDEMPFACLLGWLVLAFGVGDGDGEIMVDWVCASVKWCGGHFSYVSHNTYGMLVCCVCVLGRILELPVLWRGQWRSTTRRAWVFSLEEKRRIDDWGLRWSDGLQPRQMDGCLLLSHCSLQLPLAIRRRMKNHASMIFLFGIFLYSLEHWLRAHTINLHG